MPDDNIFDQKGLMEAAQAVMSGETVKEDTQEELTLDEAVAYLAELNPAYAKADYGKFRTKRVGNGPFGLGPKTSVRRKVKARISVPIAKHTIDSKVMNKLTGGKVKLQQRKTPLTRRDMLGRKRVNVTYSTTDHNPDLSHDDLVKLAKAKKGNPLKGKTVYSPGGVSTGTSLTVPAAGHHALPAPQSSSRALVPYSASHPAPRGAITTHSGATLYVGPRKTSDKLRDFGDRSTERAKNVATAVGDRVDTVTHAATDHWERLTANKETRATKRKEAHAAFHQSWAAHKNALVQKDGISADLHKTDALRHLTNLHSWSKHPDRDHHLAAAKSIIASHTTDHEAVHSSATKYDAAKKDRGHWYNKVDRGLQAAASHITGDGVHAAREKQFGLLRRNAENAADKVTANKGRLKSSLNRMAAEGVDATNYLSEEGKNGYVAFHKGKRHELYADTKYQAQQKAAKHFGAKKSWDVAVELATKGGKQVTHTPMESLVSQIAEVALVNLKEGYDLISQPVEHGFSIRPHSASHETHVNRSIDINQFAKTHGIDPQTVSVKKIHGGSNHGDFVFKGPNNVFAQGPQAVKRKTPRVR